MRFLYHTQRRTTVGRTPLDEWPACRRDFYLTTHNTHNRQNIHTPGGIKTHELRRRAAADLRLRPRGHWDRQPKYKIKPLFSDTVKFFCPCYNSVRDACDAVDYPFRLIRWREYLLGHSLHDALSLSATKLPDRLRDLMGTGGSFPG